MQPIPQPHVLDADRILVNDRGGFFADHEARADLFDKALHETCAYAQQLWLTLDDARRYLTDCLPPDPRSPDGIHAPVGAHPTGPDDDQGWNEWVATFAAVTSVMCGPHGDSGYGIKEAEHAASIRRTAPIVRLRTQHPEVQQPTRAGLDIHPTLSATPGAATPSEAAVAGSTKPVLSTQPRASKTVGIIVLAALAIRGLLPRRR